MTFAGFFPTPVFTTETYFVQVFVGVTQSGVREVAPAKPVQAEETLVLQAVDLIFRVQADGNEGATLNVWRDQR